MAQVSPKGRGTILSILLALALATALQNRTLRAMWWANAAYVGLAAVSQGVSDDWINPEKMFLKSEATAPTNQDGIRRGLGQLYLFQHQYPEAIHRLKRALSVSPGDPIAGLFLGRALWDTGEQSDAIRIWRQVGAGGYFLSHGKKLAHTKRWDEAVDALRLAVEIDPMSAEAHSELGRALVENGQAAEAIPELEMALGYHLREVGTETYFWLGRAYEAASRRDEALWAYQEAYARLSSASYLTYFIGRVLFNQRRYEEAERYLRIRIQASPPHSGAHYMLAQIYVQRGDRARAERELVQAIAIAPSVARFHELLGDVYLQQNRADASAREYSTAFCLAPSASWRARIKQRLRQLGAGPTQCQE